MTTELSPCSARAEAIIELQKYGKCKTRSFQTSSSKHIPALTSRPKGTIPDGSSTTESVMTTSHQSSNCTFSPSAILLGDSMIERMETTGQSPSFEPWPSTTLLSDQDAEALSIQRRSDIFNGGVGGDKFENIIFRLAGISDAAHPLQGLLSVLDCQEVRLWVVQAGTNNLHPRLGLREKDLEMLRVMLEAVLRASAPNTKILLTGLFHRKDIQDQLIDEANREYECMVDVLNKGFGQERVEFLPAPQEIDKGIHLVDHVHLNEQGYRVWAKVLVPKMMSMMRA